MRPNAHTRTTILYEPGGSVWAGNATGTAVSGEASACTSSTFSPVGNFSMRASNVHHFVQVRPASHDVLSGATFFFSGSVTARRKVGVLAAAQPESVPVAAASVVACIDATLDLGVSSA